MDSHSFTNKSLKFEGRHTALHLWISVFLYLILSSITRGQSDSRATSITKDSTDEQLSFKLRENRKNSKILFIILMIPI